MTCKPNTDHFWTVLCCFNMRICVRLSQICISKCMHRCCTDKSAVFCTCALPKRISLYIDFNLCSADVSIYIFFLPCYVVFQCRSLSKKLTVSVVRDENTIFGQNKNRRFCISSYSSKWFQKCHVDINYFFSLEFIWSVWPHYAWYVFIE